MPTRIVVVGMVAGLLGGASLFAAACSTSAPPPFGPPAPDAAHPDAPTGAVGAGVGRPDAALPDAGHDAGRTGNCTPLKGPACDLVLQDCPQGNQECAVTTGADGGLTTACVA